MQKKLFLIMALLFFVVTEKTVAQNTCNIEAPKIEFKNGTCTLTANAKGQLESLATEMKGNKSCTIIIAAQGTTKTMQALATCRTEAIKKYLVMKEVSENQLTIKVSKSEDTDIVILQAVNAQ